jgi:putative membrane protein
VLRMFLVSWAVLAIAFAVTAWLIDGVSVSGGIVGYLWISALFGVINTFIGPILRLISLPFIILSFGLVLIVVNAFLLELTDALTGDLTIQSFFWDAILAAIVLSIATMVVGAIVRSATRVAT